MPYPRNDPTGPVLIVLGLLTLVFGGAWWIWLWWRDEL